MLCLGLEPGMVGWQLQANPLSYGVTPALSGFNWTEEKKDFRRSKVDLASDKTDVVVADVVADVVEECKRLRQLLMTFTFYKSAFRREIWIRRRQTLNARIEKSIWFI